MKYERTANAELSQAQFEHIKARLYSYCGINLNNDKQSLVKSRLSKRLAVAKLENFDQYLSYVENDPNEFSNMIDALTTNKTNFFREPHHFDFLKTEVLPSITGRRLRIWSTACSTGEEPYTIAMLLHDSIPDIFRWDIKILATDISTSVLHRATQAVYSDEALAGVSARQRERYFKQENAGSYRVRDSLRSMVSYARLNLMGAWKMRGTFDIIFCRNVMIYFDKPTQIDLVNRFYDLVTGGGYLFIGHSESLSRMEHRFQYIQPAIYLK